MANLASMFKNLTKLSKSMYNSLPNFNNNPNFMSLVDLTEGILERNAWAPTMGQLTGTSHSGFGNGIRRMYNILQDSNRLSGVPFFSQIK